MELESLFINTKNLDENIWKSMITKYKMLNSNEIVFDEPLRYIILRDEEYGFNILMFHRETHDFISWHGNWSKIEPVGKDREILIVTESSNNPFGKTFLKGLWRYTGKMLAYCSYTSLEEKVIEGVQVIYGIKYSGKDIYEDIFDYETGLLIVHGQYPLRKIKVKGKCFLYANDNILQSLYTLKGERIFQIPGVKDIKVEGSTLIVKQKVLGNLLSTTKIDLSKYI